MVLWARHYWQLASQTWLYSLELLEHLGMFHPPTLLDLATT
jgi:hypothetical protein